MKFKSHSTKDKYVILILVVQIGFNKLSFILAKDIE